MRLFGVPKLRAIAKESGLPAASMIMVRPEQAILHAFQDVAIDPIIIEKIF